MCDTAIHSTLAYTQAHPPPFAQIVRSADIIIAAIGMAEFVQKDWVKPGAVVIDVGVNFVDDSTRKTGRRMCGDVEYKGVSAVASKITPVPGGVGPMTVAMLMRVSVEVVVNTTSLTHSAGYRTHLSTGNAVHARRASLTKHQKIVQSSVNTLCVYVTLALLLQRD